MGDQIQLSEQIQNSVDTAVSLMTTYGLDVLGAIVILIIGWWLSGWAKSLTARALSKIKNADKTLTGFLSSLVKYIVLAITIMAVLDRFGVETTSLVAVFGAAGLAIGLALQGTLSNVAAGVMLLIFRPLRVGDFVDIGGETGTVKSLGLFVTELSTVDNVQKILPNSNIWGNTITNYNRYNTRRQDVVVGIGYGDNIDEAMDVMMDVVKKDTRVLEDPAPTIFVGNLGESSVDITLRFWMKSGDFWQTTWDTTKAVKEGLDKAGIEIPFPQRVIHGMQAVETKKPKKKKAA